MQSQIVESEVPAKKSALDTIAGKKLAIKHPSLISCLQYCNFSPEDAIELSKAMGLPIREVLSAMMAPERVLLHSTLAATQTKLFNQGSNETERGHYISTVSQKILKSIEIIFQVKAEEVKKDLSKKYSEIDSYIDRIAESVPPGRLNTDLYRTMWELDNFDESWKLRAVDTFRNIRQRIDSGEYTPSKGWDIKKLTAYWCKRRLEYKLYRQSARKIIESYIELNFTKDEKLRLMPPKDRKTLIFTGGSGSGKSTLSEKKLATLSRNQRRKIYLQDTDDLKIALLAASYSDGLAPQNQANAVHDEASNLIREVVRKITFLVKTGRNTPSIFINCVSTDEHRIEEALAGGSSVEVHHISIAPELALESVEKRAKKLKRLPPRDFVISSIQESANDILKFSPFGGAQLKVYLYSRNASGVKLHAILDMRNKNLIFSDLQELQLTLARAKLADNQSDSINQAFKLLLNQGINLVMVNPVNHEEVLLRLTAEKRELMVNKDATNPLSRMAVSYFRAFASATSSRSIPRLKALKHLLAA